MEARHEFRVARRNGVCLVLVPRTDAGLEGTSVAQGQRASEDGRDVRPTTRPAGRGDEKRTTVVQLSIEHWKDLPADAAAQIAQRAYSLLFARGVEVGVTAKVMEQKGEV
jgi:hypothetical protein